MQEMGTNTSASTFAAVHFAFLWWIGSLAAASLLWLIIVLVVLEATLVGMVEVLAIMSFWWE
jgi:hypothetical protein